MRTTIAILALLTLAACAGRTPPGNGCPNVDQIRVAGVCQDRDGSTGAGPNEPNDPPPELIRRPAR